MKITFFSNYLNHHQLPFCNAMYKKFGEDFHFIACTPFNPARKALGYVDMNYEYPFVLRAYEDKEQLKQAEKLAIESDIVISGAAPEKFLASRLEKTDKISFHYSERIFKNGIWHAISPRARKNIYNKFGKFKNKPLFLLCAGSYVAMDYFLLGAFKNKAYKWGYFPETVSYSDFESVLAQKKEKSIIWVARFIQWKHPELVVKTANILRSKGYEFKIKMIGTGELVPNIKEMISNYGLDNYIELCGSMPPEEVRKNMEKSQIFLFTSDKGEGWGAVLNESMNSGCAVIANKAIGAVPYLIKHGENGLVYKGNSAKKIAEYVELLFNDGDLRKKLAANAYSTMRTEWNAETAAERVVKLAEELLSGKESPFENGPCCKA